MSYPMRRIECKIHGGYWRMPLVSATETHATVELGDGLTRDLPWVSNEPARGGSVTLFTLAENAANADHR